MNIRGIISTKGASVATIPPDATIADAAEHLARHGVGALVVSTDGDRIVGIISERDLARGVADHGAAVVGMLVRDLMTADVVTCDPTDSVERLMGVMTARRIRHLPVVDDGPSAAS